MDSMRLFKRENGVYYAAFERGKKRSLATTDKREAERLFAALKREYLKGRLIELDHGERITLDEFMREYLDRRKADGIDADTLRMDSLSIRSLADVIGGGSALKAIDDKRITKFKTACIARGVKKVSINSYLRHLRAALNSAVTQGYIKKAPHIKNFKLGGRLPEILSPSEVFVLLNHIEPIDHELYRIVKFALWTGCRLSEIMCACWQNVSGDTIRVIGKGDKERTVPLLEGAIEAMGPTKNIGPIFIQWHPDTVSHRFKSAAIGCGLGRVHFHNLRHSAATQMVNSGIPLEVVQEILGHADIRTTQLYAQILGKLVSTEMQKLKY